MHDAKSSLSRLVKRAASGEEILIAKPRQAGRIAHPDSEAAQEAAWGHFQGEIEMTEDFDAPLVEFEDCV
jgi:antitoxin (DNA-binding transcriptional repressor) of toxin-antitoxin stability system